MGLLTIGTFAKASRLSPKALRLYDELGLLTPARVDPVTGYRLYAQEQLEQARLVAWLRRLGMPLARVQHVCTHRRRTDAGHRRDPGGVRQGDRARPGGRLSLDAFVEEHAEALEADLLRHYAVDLLDWHRGTLTSRRLAVLVKHLPRDSAVNRDLHGETVEWDSSTHLLAAAVDHLAVANWMTATINSGEDADPLDYPEAVPRPDGSRADTSMNDESGIIGSTPADSLPAPADLARFFA